MKFETTVKRLIDGQWRARSRSSLAGDATACAPTREAALEKLAQEIRYRIEWCPCSAVSDQFVELEVHEERASRWPGTVF